MAKAIPMGLQAKLSHFWPGIVAACDAYEAMTAERPYRPAKGDVEALSELEDLAGRQFDPQVVAALAAVLRSGERAQLAVAGDDGRGLHLLALSPLAGYDPLTLYRTLIEQSSGGVLVLDLNLLSVLVSHRLRGLLGVDQGGGVGVPCVELNLPCLDQSSLGKGPCPGCPVVRAIETKETIFDVRQSEEKVFTLICSPLQADGTPVGAALFVEDATERLTDPLTGLYNYRLFQETLDAEIARARRYQRRFSLMVLDVDGFKTVNDRWGHPYGDEVLRRLARLLRSQVRRSDLVFRTGGDEFAVVGPETNGEGVGVLAQRLNEAIQSSFHWESLSISWGVATMPDDGPELSAAALYELADRRLYDERMRAGRSG